MKKMKVTTRFARGLFAAALALTVSTSLNAQGGQDFSQVEIQTTRLGDNLYMLTGRGGTTGALVGPDGVLLVDTQFAPLTEKIVAAVRQLSDSPIRFVINTHLHGDHTGGNANFASLGAAIMSRDKLRWRLAHPNPAPDGSPGTPAPPAALPMVTYEGTVTFHMNGEQVEAIGVPTAHTDGDTLVRFVNADVLMTGDFYRSIGYPNMDLANGGSMEGMLAGLGLVIGMAGPDTKILPGHGPIVDRNAVIEHRDIMLAVRDRVAALVREGKTVEEVIAARPTAEADARVESAATTSERFIRQLYREISGSM